MRKWQKGLLVFFIGGMLLGAVYLGTTNMTLGGSKWQFDYAYTDFNLLNVDIEAVDEYPEPYSYTPPDSYDLPRGITITPNVAGTYVQNAYEWWADPDGVPMFDGVAWQGIIPDIGITVSQPFRCDRNGEKIDAFAPASEERQVGDELIGLYYYTFSVTTKTKQDSFIVPPTIQSFGQSWISYECANVEVESILTVCFQRSMFTEVEGEFMSAKVQDVEFTDLQLDLGNWAIAPKIAIMQDKGQGIPVVNEHREEGIHSVDLRFICALQPGLSQALGELNLNSYEVWVSKHIVMEVLLREPLVIGETGEYEKMQDPPAFGFFDIAGYIMWIIIAVIVIIVLVVIIYALRIFGGWKR